MNNFKLTSVGDATLATDALNRQTADDRYYHNTTPLNYILAPDGNVSINNYKLINISEPTISTDAATKNYVDTNAGITQSDADLRYY